MEEQKTQEWWISHLKKLEEEVMDSAEMPEPNSEIALPVNPSYEFKSQLKKVKIWQKPIYEDKIIPARIVE